MFELSEVDVTAENKKTGPGQSSRLDIAKHPRKTKGPRSLAKCTEMLLSPIGETNWPLLSLARGRFWNFHSHAKHTV